MPFLLSDTRVGRGHVGAVKKQNGTGCVASVLEEDLDRLLPPRFVCAGTIQKALSNVNAIFL
jgi:hypothetical protein